MGAADATSDGSGAAGPLTLPESGAVTLDDHADHAARPAVAAAAAAAAARSATTAPRAAPAASGPPRAAATSPTRLPGSVVSQSGVRRPPVADWARYHIEGFLGAGGMGSVFKARDPRLGRFVALKFLRDRDAQAEQRRRFDREARAQARLDHPNICKIFEVGEVDGHPYLAMQYVEGQPLSAIKHELTVEQKVKLIREVAAALHAAHREGLIHRDVKPGEGAIDPAGRANDPPRDTPLARRDAARGRWLARCAATRPGGRCSPTSRRCRPRRKRERTPPCRGRPAAPTC